MFISRALIASWLIQQISFLSQRLSLECAFMNETRRSPLFFSSATFFLDKETFSFCREKLCECCCSCTQMENCSALLCDWDHEREQDKRENRETFSFRCIIWEVFQIFQLIRWKVFVCFGRAFQFVFIVILTQFSQSDCKSKLSEEKSLEFSIPPLLYKRGA